jgi:hypothetical protein
LLAYTLRTSLFFRRLASGGEAPRGISSRRSKKTIRLKENVTFVLLLNEKQSSLWATVTQDLFFNAWLLKPWFFKWYLSFCVIAVTRQNKLNMT